MKSKENIKNKKATFTKPKMKINKKELGLEGRTKRRMSCPRYI
jgi:hypothetical protein